MKYTKFLLTGIFLLIIVTMGAACASENITEDAAMTAESEDMSLENDSCDALGAQSYSDEDFYVEVQENYSQGMNSWDSKEMIYIYSYSQKNGTFTVSVDDVEKQSYDITDGYFAVEKDIYNETYNRYFQYVCPKDLGIDNYGIYNIKVKFNDNILVDSRVSLNEMEDFDIWLQNPYYCEEDYWNIPSFIIIDSNNFSTGTLEIFVNGTRKISYAVNNGNFEEIADCSNKSRYVAPSDLITAYGTYNIQINFTQNGTSRQLACENVVVGEFPPTVDPRLDVYLDLYEVVLPADNIAHIYLPHEANGTLTVSYNNVVNQTVPYSKGIASFYMESWNLNHLGENVISFTYSGEDFGTLTTNTTCIVVPNIQAPDFVSEGDEFKISVLTHEWVNGDFNVYDYNGGVKGEKLASAWLHKLSYEHFATASVTLPANRTGSNRYYLEFDYYGGRDYVKILEVYVVRNTANITVDIPGEVEINESFNITVNAPDIDYTFAQISVDGGDVEFLMFESGEVRKNLSFSHGGYHTVKVLYDNRYYSNGELIGEVYMDTFTVNAGVKTNISTCDVEGYPGKNLTVTLNDADGNTLAGKTLLIDINGTVYNRTTDANGQVIFTVNLAPGEYLANISFRGDEGLLSSSGASKIRILKTATNLTSDDLIIHYKDNDNLAVTLRDAGGNVLANKTVLIDVNGTLYNEITDSNGQALLAVDLLPGVYPVNISFAGDGDYANSTTCVHIAVSPINVMLRWNGNSLFYGENNTLYISLFNWNNCFSLAGKELIYTFNGIDYNVTSNEDSHVIIDLDLPVGNYTASLRFAEDNLFHMINNGTIGFSISKMGTSLTYSSVTLNVENRLCTYNIILSDVRDNKLSGKLISMEVNGTAVNATTDENGVAVLTVKASGEGIYYDKIIFEGDENYSASIINSTFTWYKMQTELNASDLSTVYKSKDNLMVTLTDSLGHALANRSVVIDINGTVYNRTTDADGQVILAIDLIPGEYVANISFAGDEGFKNSSTSVRISVSPITVLPVISLLTLVYGQKHVLCISLPSLDNDFKLTNKSLIFTFNGTDYPVTTDKYANINFDLDFDLPAGNYNATLRFVEDNLYRIYNDGIIGFPIYQASTCLSFYSITLNVENRIITYHVTLKDVYDNPLAGKFISLNVNGTLVNGTTDENGIAVLQFIAAGEGVYHYRIVFEGDENYTGSFIKSNFTWYRMKTGLDAPDVEATYNASAELNIRLTTFSGDALANKTVLIDINGTNYTRTTDSNGSVVLGINLAAGEYMANISFAGDLGYKPSSAAAKISINKIRTYLASNNINVSYGTGDNLTITLKDMYDNKLANKTISVDIGGVNYTGITDKMGKVSIPVDLKGGSYIAVIRFKGDDEYGESSHSATVTVNRIDSRLSAPQIATVYNVAKDLVVTLTDANGNALAQKQISINLNGVPLTKTTDKNGQVRLAVNLPAKTYAAVIVFKGDNSFNPQQINTKVIVKKAKPKISAKSKAFKLKSKTKKFRATLKDNKGRAIKKVKLTLKIKNKRYTAKTNSKGVAKFKIKLTKKGRYNAKISFKSTSNYNAASKSVKIKIK